MSTAAINSASGHRQGAKKNENKKSGMRASKAAGGANQVNTMNSLINDESILS